MTPNFARLSLLCGILFCLSNTVCAQQTTETKTFSAVEYQVSLNKVKTADIAKSIQESFEKLDGVQKCEVIFLNYSMFLRVDHNTITPEKIKEVLQLHGAEMKTLKTDFIQ